MDGNSRGSTSTFSGPQQQNGEYEWRQQQQKQRNKRILNKNKSLIGQKNINDGKLVIAPKKAFLHVSRFSPETTIDDITNYLQGDFPEVKCGKLSSKYPYHYSSFKIMIDLVNLEKAKDPSIWPRGIYVSRFFQKRQRLDNVKT